MEETKNKTGKKGRESYSHAKADARKEQKRLDAEKRQAKHDSLTLREKIAKATKRGGSVRELQRLNTLLLAAKEAKAKAKVVVSAEPKTRSKAEPKKGQKRVSTYRQKQAKN
jgi:hypothetical protein